MKTIRTITLLSLVMLSQILCGCGAAMEKLEGKEFSPTDETKQSNDFTEADKSSSIPMAEDIVINRSSSTGSKTIEVKDQIKTEAKIALKIIKNADVSFQVEKYNESRLKLIEIINKNGGILSAENQTSNSYLIENNMVVRVKSDGFDDLVEKLMVESIYTEYKKITSDDVTEQYIDAEARLKTKKATAARFEDILKKASRVQDILEVQNEINDLQEEIEATEGKLRYLNDKVQYSTINLHFFEKLDYKAAPEIGFGTKLLKGFAGGWNFLLKIFIGLAYIWPLLLIIGIVVFVIIRQVNKKNRPKLQ